MSLVWYGYKIILRVRNRELVELVIKYIGCKQGNETWTSTEVIFTYIPCILILSEFFLFAN